MEDSMYVGAVVSVAPTYIESALVTELNMFGKKLTSSAFLLFSFFWQK